MKQELIKRGASNLLQCWLIVLAMWKIITKKVSKP